MPRGQWDRTKTKEQRAAERAAALKKGGKAPQALAAAPKVSPAPTKKQTKKTWTRAKQVYPKVQPLKGVSEDIILTTGLRKLEAAQCYIGTLVSCINGMGKEPTVPNELFKEFGVALETTKILRQQIFGLAPSEQPQALPAEEEAPAPSNGTEAVAKAPVPIQPPQNVQAPFPPAPPAA